MAEEKRDEEEREGNFEEWAGRLRREQEVRLSSVLRTSLIEMACVAVGSDE